MPNTPTPITLRELRRMLRDDDVTEQQIRPYLELDTQESRAFAPSIRVNPALVTDDGHEGDLAVAVLNSISKYKRQAVYRTKVAKHFDAIRIVSEGDSWFQYPWLLDDVIDHLMAKADLAIFSLGGAGHLLADMVAEGEIPEALSRERPEFFLISGGGNDLMHPLICGHQITPKISLNTRRSVSMIPSFSINGRIRSSGQLGRW